MSYAYLIAPFFAWLVCGILKFLVNSIRECRWAFDLIGYGGMPSNHAAIVTSMLVLVGLREGVDHPAFGVALSTAFIVLLDATSLRRQIGLHAQHLNRLNTTGQAGESLLRERIGHSRAEVLVGLAVGAFIAALVHFFV